MRALYKVYDMPMREELGQLWLGNEERKIIRERGFCTILLQPPFEATCAPACFEPAYQELEVVRVGIDRNRQGEWLLTTDGTAALVEKCRSLQEQKMRFPLPISLFPG